MNLKPVEQFSNVCGESRDQMEQIYLNLHKQLISVESEASKTGLNRIDSSRVFAANDLLELYDICGHLTKVVELLIPVFGIRVPGSRTQSSAPGIIDLRKLREALVEIDNI